MKANWSHIAILWGIVALPAMIPAMAIEPANLLNDWRFYIQALAIGIPQALLVVLIMRLAPLGAVATTTNVAAHTANSVAANATDSTATSAIANMVTSAGDDRFGLRLPRRIGRPLIIAIVSALAALIIAALMSLLLGAVAPQVVRPAWQLTNRALLPLALLAMIAIAYREELFFRAFLLSHLEALGLTPATRILVGGLLFGLAHLAQGLAGIVVASTIGLLFGILFERYRNVHIVAVAHTLYNMAVLLAATTVRIALW